MKKKDVQWTVVAVRDQGLNRYVSVYGPFPTMEKADSYARHCETYDAETCNVCPLVIEKDWLA
jgi:hypothetical protein